jgi:predicted HTH domain antitoxin
MSITIQLPDEVASLLGSTPEAAAKRSIESAAAEGYREKRFSRGQVRRMLGLSWHETEEFLARQGCDLHYSEQDLEQDRKTLAKLLPSFG